MTNFKLNLNKQALQINKAAHYKWEGGAAAHEGVTLQDGTQLPGYQWADITWLPDTS